MENCNNCFCDYLVQCTAEINVFAQLAPAQQFTWIVTDKFEHEYSGTFITDAQGFWSIPVEDLPAGLLTPFSGSFLLQVIDDSCKPIKFKIAQEYDCITFEVKGGSREKNSLGCDFQCVDINPGGGGTPAIFPFTGSAIVDIPWTDLLRGLYGNTPTINVYHIVDGVSQMVTGNVVVTLTGGVYLLENINLDNGGPADGYIIISA